MIDRLFGTDGIRGVANVWPMTPELALKTGQAIGAWALHHSGNWGKKRPRPRVIIGKDTRIANYMLEQALSSGICSMGVDTLLLGPLPTPAIAFLVTSMRTDAGVVISASHNAYEYSGIKIFGRDGDKLPDDAEGFLTDLILGKEPMPVLPTGENIGKSRRIDDAAGRYIVNTKAAFRSDLDLIGKRIVLDCAHGAAYRVAPLIFQELGAEVIAVGVDPDGTNINAGYGALHPERICEMVQEYRADIGISLDGDADRVILADETGTVVDGNAILAILALEMEKAGQLAGDTVVGTVMCNLGLKVALAKHGIAFSEVPVGDRNVFAAMKKNGFGLGGEPSGHIIIGRQGSSGDGVLAALKILEAMRSQSKSLSKLASVMTTFPQILRNVRVKNKDRAVEEIPQVSAAIERIQKELDGKGRVNVRYSGTEPVVRVMVEGPEMDQVTRYADKLASLFSEV